MAVRGDAGMAALCWCTLSWSQHPSSAMGGFLLGVGAQDRDHLENCHTGTGVEHTFSMTAARGVKQHGAGSEILIVMRKVGLVLLVQLPTSLLHALGHPGRAAAEHPDLLHLGKKRPKGSNLTAPAPPQPSSPWPCALQQLWAQMMALAWSEEAFGEVVTSPWSCWGHGGRMGPPRVPASARGHR